MKKIFVLEMRRTKHAVLSGAPICSLRRSNPELLELLAFRKRVKTNSGCRVGVLARESHACGWHCAKTCLREQEVPFAVMLLTRERLP